MAASSSSSSDSSSSRSSSPEPDNKQKQTIKSVSKTKDEAEDSSSSSGSESDNDESSSDMDTSDDAPQAVVNVVAPKPYKPPSGFKSAKQLAPPSSASSSILSNLNGKQVIHITAPSFLPLSKVKEISMSKIAEGQPILSFDGANYGIPTESLSEEGAQGKSLLLFDHKSQTYFKQADNIPSYHIQELMGVPEADKAAVEALRDTVKPARPQPKNLKMRFRPVGSLPAPPETLGSDSDSEPSFKVPAGETERKRKHHHTDADAAQTTSLPSRKKSRKHTQENGDEEQGHKKSKKSHKDTEEKKRKKPKA
ncbi:hypothetical protein N7520_008529 [Penicillium odoratum]|uniref:uncharacterized protein n=1 Tax=Penicillium odoratum TaxID=1167516 RepID=UPI0025467C05|nr:uncharacterized protein N7520_008529 [Penicillium odoratum]KAJ5751612.1 hypothetical protein N7520_008529 [Penicillium odoratum]